MSKETLDLLNQNWPFMILAGLVWLIRLEAKVLYIEKDHNDNKKALWDKVNSVEQLLIEVKTGIARIEGKLDKG